MEWLGGVGGREPGGIHEEFAAAATLAPAGSAGLGVGVWLIQEARATQRLRAALRAQAIDGQSAEEQAGLENQKVLHAVLFCPKDFYSRNFLLSGLLKS